MINRDRLSKAISTLSKNPAMNDVLATAILDAKVPNIAEFLGQVFHESGNLGSFKENLNYTTDALVSKFSRARISLAQAEKFGRNEKHKADQQAIANTIYGGEWGKRNLGNTQPNDGWHFKGVGPIQLTGRGNITKFAKAYGDLDLIVNPHRIAEEPKVAAAAAIWYWMDYKHLDRQGSNVSEITRLVTGSSAQGYNQRLNLTNHFRSLLK